MQNLSFVLTVPSRRLAFLQSSPFRPQAKVRTETSNINLCAVVYKPVLQSYSLHHGARNQDANAGGCKRHIDVLEDHVKPREIQAASITSKAAETTYRKQSPEE